jgi:hypothetical protein
MKDSRIGESLWSIWDGDGYAQELPDSTIYFTEDHVDLNEDVVRRALASSIQRDGIAYSLGDSFKMVDASIINLSWVGTSDGEMHQELCKPSGETYSGSMLDRVVEATFVEVPFVD